MSVDFLRKTILGLNIGIVSLRYYVLVSLAIVIWLFSELLIDQQTSSEKEKEILL